MALVAADLGAACARLEADLGVRSPYRDPGVAAFGLDNAVYELGDTFVEHFAATREWEHRQWQDAVTDWELRRTFERM